MLRFVAAGLLDLLAPPTCAACGLAHEGTQNAQAHDGHREREPAYAAHAASLANDSHGATATGFCAACAVLIERAPSAMRPPAQHAAATLYQGPMADAIRAFKYGPNSSLAYCLSRWLVDSALHYAGRIDAVVPMPLHTARLRERGWNPSTLLARPVARALALPLRPSWLQRVRPTATQAGLSRTARQQNVRGAFQAARVPTARVLLIDDVHTTGATLQEATRCLEARGHQVSSLALAWAADTATADVEHSGVGALTE